MAPGRQHRYGRKFILLRRVLVMNIGAKYLDRRGFTLIELVIVIVVLGVLSAVAVKKMQPSIDTARYEQTKKELDELAFAIVGNPGLYANGARADFGYVGDVGSLPPNLDALVTNPGGYATWDGPYMSSNFGATDFKTDGWGTAYILTGMIVRSTGSGSNIDKPFANSSAKLLANSLVGTISDANMTLPGTVYKDSLLVQFIYPNGTGGTTIAGVNPDANGYFSISSLPIGNHTLRIVYIPDSDTVTYPTTIYPGRTAKLNILFPADLWP